VLNRLNVCIVAFNWQLPFEQRYIPSWMEVGISLFMITGIVLVFRFIAGRMPVFYTHPDYRKNH
jgi:hypothetical protein